MLSLCYALQGLALEVSTFLLLQRFQPEVDQIPSDLGASSCYLTHATLRTRPFFFCHMLPTSANLWRWGGVSSMQATFSCHIFSRCLTTSCFPLLLSVYFLFLLFLGSRLTLVSLAFGPTPGLRGKSYLPLSTCTPRKKKTTQNSPCTKSIT